MYLNFDKKKFLLALSFSGDKRPFIAQLSDFLKEIIGEENIFYDYFYEGELSGPDLDTKLQRIYGIQSEVVAVFLSSAYETREWCFGVEWRVIRDVIKKLDGDKIKYFKFDETINLPGLLSIDGYINIRDRSPQEIGTILIKILRDRGKFIIPKHDDVVIVISQSLIGNEGLERLLGFIKKLVGKAFLVNRISSGSTILYISLFDGGSEVLYRQVKMKGKIGPYSVSRFSKNGVELIDLSSQSKKQSRKNKPEPGALANILLKEGITQARLAAESGVNYATISQIHNGRNTRPRAATKRKITDGLNALIRSDKYKVQDIFPDQPRP